MPFITRHLLLATTCVASLLGAAHFIERPSFLGGAAEHIETTVLSEEEEAMMKAAAADSNTQQQQQCTIVFINNRKGCVFEPKDVLKGAREGVLPPNTTTSTTTTTINGNKQADISSIWSGGPGLRRGGIKAAQSPTSPSSPRSFGSPQLRSWGEGGSMTVTATEATDIQPLMDCRQEGYNGADVAASFRAPPFDGDGGKPYTLWLLGDTFLGRMEGEGESRKRLPGYFVHNSVVTVPVWANVAKEMDPDAAVFWHNVSADGGCPASLFRTASEKAREDENECHEGGEYLWPVSGMAVDLRGSLNTANGTAAQQQQQQTPPNSKLVLLATRWAYIPWIEEDIDLTRSIFNFNVLGTTLIIVDNAHQPPPQWQYRTRDLPGTGASDNWFSAIAPAATSGGVEVATREDEMVYLMGTSGKPPMEPSRQILGRVSVKCLLDLTLEDMEVWGSLSSNNNTSEGAAAGATTTAGGAAVVEKAEADPQPQPPAEAAAAAAMDWAPLDKYMTGDLEAAPLLSPVYTGISLHYSKYLQRWYSIAIDWMSKRALLQTASEITGPWDSTPIYDIPAPFNGTKLMAYTGKAHPELAAENEIVFTYVANTPGVVYPLFDEGADVLYVPRFVRLTFEEKDNAGKKKGNGGTRERELRTRRRRRQKAKRAHHSKGHL